MVVQGVGDFLRDIIREHDGKTVAVIGHRMTRYALEYWCGGGASLEEIVRAPWVWRDIPVWRHEADARDLQRRAAETREQTRRYP